MNKQTITSYLNRVFVLLFSFIAVLSMFSCEKEKKDPAVETTTIVGLAATSYYVSAKVIERGDYKISDYGFVYYIGSENSGSIYGNQKVSLGSSPVADTFSVILNTEEINYYQNNYRCYARAYITNEKGTLYGNIISTELARVNLKGIEPDKGKSGDTITLNGSYFSLVPSENHVYFDYTSADVISATAKTLKVRVPFGISSYYDNMITIKVVTNGYETILQDGFKLLASPDGFSPNYGTWGTSIYITGSGMYNSSLYFDDVFVANNSNSSTSFYVYVPNNIQKKKFKLFLSTDGVKTEIPGGYFTMSDLSVYSPNTWQFNRGSTVYLNGSGFNPQSAYNRLLLGNTPIVAYSSYGSYAYFDIPYSMALGSYVARVTNSIDTVTLSNQITIVAK